jgi:hypothetical protein
LGRLLRGRSTIVYLAGSDGGGHLSPLVGFRHGMAVLPYTEEGQLSVAEFERRWSGPGYPRQCILVRAEHAAPPDRGRPVGSREVQRLIGGPGR